jgi:hypothetical protein
MPKFAEAECCVCGQGRCALCGDLCKSCARQSDTLNVRKSACVAWRKVSYTCRVDSINGSKGNET